MTKTMRILLWLCVSIVLIAVAWFFFFPIEVDALFVNGRIYTMDDELSVAEAIAVDHGKIAGVGSESSMTRRFKAKTVIDLQGKSVFPGFIDAHAHFLSLGIARMTVDLVGAASEQEAAGRVKVRVAKVQKDQWIRGRGWDQNLWKSRQFPSHRNLDGVSPQNPVLLTRVDGHACWVNSKAMAIAGITKGMKDPPGGKIMRDASGNPTGVFVDAAMDLLVNRLPPLSDAESREALDLAIKECLSYGITSVQDMGVDMREVDLYKKVIDERRLPVRIYAAIGGTGETWNAFLKSGPLLDYGDNRLTVRAVKLYMDGALGSRGAALIEPYSDDPGNRGLTVTSEEDLTKTVEDALTHGFQVCTHAIGDRGNNIVLNVYEAALKRHPVEDHRLRIEHAQVLEQSDIPRFKQLDVLPSMQPTHCTSDMYWAEARLGPRRVRGAYSWRSLLQTGVIIPGGSDFPVEDPNPLLGIYAAVTRRDRQGRPISAEQVKAQFQLSPEGFVDSTRFRDGWYGDEKLTREEAVKSFTRWAAFAEFAEGVKGSLEKGQLADFVVFSDDVIKVPAKDLPGIHVEMTVVGGEVVYRKSGQK